VRIGTRLWIFGAFLPVAGLVAALFFAGYYFQVELERQLDQALLTQAATEAVSLFDGADGKPHLHMETSPLAQQVRGFAPRGVFFGPDGSVAVAHPPGPTRPGIRVLPDRPGPPTLFTRDNAAHGHERVLRASLANPEGVRYVLELASSTDGIEGTVTTFRRMALAIALVLGAALIALQLWQGRIFARRVGALTSHMRALREGDLAASPPPDGGADEIADLRAVVEEATRRLEEARQAQDRLIAEAAHELRTPLGLMRTEVDLALRRHRDTAELRQALEEVRREVDRLAGLSSRLLDLAVVGRGSWDRAPGDLAEVARESVEAARGVAEEKGVLVHLDAPTPVVLSFHAGSLRQAIDNLISNAVKYSPRGGEVRVAVERLGAMARVSVSDRGPGIPFEERERVFEPFHRGTNGALQPGAKGGAGLGLSIVRAIAQHHGGRAFVAGGAGGAEVVVEIPLEAPVSARRREESAPA
jgi:signal transduction histidine kinase